VLLPANQSLQADFPPELFSDNCEAQRWASPGSLNYTSYAALTAPHVSAVQAVLHGVKSRYKLPFEDALLLFDHGCLMGRVFFQGRFYTLPPLELDVCGRPYFRSLSLAQRPALEDFCKLPKGILLFYFSLLKQALGGKSISSQRLHPTTGQTTAQPMPSSLRPWLDAVNWSYDCDAEAGCKVS
jgi:hypothetical protein